MLVFVIPLQSRQVARSWEKVCRLFEICVRSVCQQDSSQFRIIVVCHELPEITFQHAHLHYIQVDFPIPDILSGTEQEIVNRKHTDKGRKMLRGLIAARDFQPTHTMFLDADDCVSRQLAGFVAQHPRANGWFIRDGYRYKAGSRWIYRKSRDFHTMCGSSNILRYDLNRLPTNPEYNRGYGYYKFYIDHGRVATWLAEAGTPLDPLPFRGSVYVVQTGENIYYDSSRLHRGWGRYLNYCWLTPAIRQEFGLTSQRLDQINL